MIDAMLEAMPVNTSKLIETRGPSETGQYYGAGNIIAVLSKITDTNASLVGISPDSRGTTKGLWRMQKNNGVWRAVEWINPPMQLGVEYRTTERYLGKPVYIKAVDFGSLPNNTIKTVTFGDNTIKMISAHGIMNGGYIIPGCTGSADYPEQEMQIFACDGGTVGVMTHIDRSKAGAVIVAKYWKTTD